MRVAPPQASHEAMTTPWKTVPMVFRPWHSRQGVPLYLRSTNAKARLTVAPSIRRR